MTSPQGSMERLARQVRRAIGSADPSAFADLLDPDVTWGAPGDRRPACANRDQVMAWYERARGSGASATVADVEVMGEHLLVTLTLRGTPAARERGGQALRWQLLGVRRGRVVDIVGFDDRTEAVAYATTATPSAGRTTPG